MRCLHRHTHESGSPIPPDGIYIARFHNALFYARLHGAEDWFKGKYTAAFLEELADNIRKSRNIRHAYVFFNNTMQGVEAAENAVELLNLMRNSAI
ncbi:MAG: DUF72 domain-containing protein [Proteobacteria bacterium]|nr:DUF72 domain-containing protein [Pseudomonadota bacterium]